MVISLQEPDSYSSEGGDYYFKGGACVPLLLRFYHTVEGASLVRLTWQDAKNTNAPPAPFRSCGAACLALPPPAPPEQNAIWQPVRLWQGKVNAAAPPASFRS